MRYNRFLIALALLVIAPCAAWAAGPRATCRALGSSDTLRPIPPSLLGAAVQAFGLQHMPPDQVLRSTVWRCRSGVVLMCNYGANLPCGRADTSRVLPPQGTAWCQQKPEADFVPAYITGHDSVWRWRCHGGVPAAEEPPARVDPRGFLVRYWKQLQ